MESDEEDSALLDDIKNRILKGEAIDFDVEDFETISNNTRLREIYSYRWWADKEVDNYFVMVNKESRTLMPGEQIYYNYGRRSNSYLLLK